MIRRIFQGVMAVLVAFTVMGGVSSTGVFSNKAEAAWGNNVKYSMYIGLNDKKANKQLITEEQAMKIVEDTCFKYVDGVTIQKATGICVDIAGKRFHENTIVCYFYDANEVNIHKIADELIASLNQGSILIEKDTVVSEDYRGQGK